MKLQVIWRDISGQPHHKNLNWHGPATQSALQDYIENYFEMLENGYRPAGYPSAPIPHCARIFKGPTLLAEWYANPKRPAESPVTAEPLGSGGIPNV